ncbi:hypothetical protein [Tepidibacter formicigenes]|jgi:hypothetical protein|uniref:Uncharacterized protein n=1 Tax=Tepidibacter formicigenes DSM 15518 TaxID=1123349 RepID=A0A1M6Q1T9_9FIRM|nr:hypothetical protein [Tepidibacter formicigenes]SHK14195.1 hypothetical protein SAMN02744037_01719 [Tepidibacter formicigenes DSM 15518]
MKIIEKNEGKKIDYTITENKITFADELMLNLKKYERDDPNHIDVCLDRFGNLVSGVIPGVAEVYVAQIDIPAREYDFIADGVDENGEPKEVPMPLPFDMEKCTLTLWALK